MLGIAKQTLRNWRSQGEGPRSARRGALVRYYPDDVRKWAASDFHWAPNVSHLTHMAKFAGVVSGPSLAVPD
jgi:hypothetical protein